jgi:O-antigen biosynthesis protein
MNSTRFSLHHFTTKARNAFAVLRAEGWRGIVQRIRPSRSYRDWIAKYDTLSDQDRQSMRAQVESWDHFASISILMRVCNASIRWLDRSLWSVRNQIYPHWELCVLIDVSSDLHVRQIVERHAKQDKRIRVIYPDSNGRISANPNSALAIATGDYVALLDADDELSEHALFWVAVELRAHPTTDLIYSDEDKIGEKGHRFEPFFKPDWNPALMLSQNVFSHLGVFRRALVEQVGGIRSGLAEAQDYDLVLRCAEKCGVQHIRHIPRVLYHLRTSSVQGISTKRYGAAATRAVQDHLNRCGTHARVRTVEGRFRSGHCQYHQVEYELQEFPRVSIIIPTSMRHDWFKTCIASILTHTTYPNFEVILAVNENSFNNAKNEPYVKNVLTDPRLKVFAYEDQPFNYSKINNWAIRQVTSPLICLLNDDTEIISADWLENLVARVQLPDVGAVGPLLLFPDESIQHAGVILGMGQSGVAGHPFVRLRKGHLGYFGRAALEQDLSCVTAACVLLRRDIFESLNGFNEQLALSYNDVDLCIRLRSAGWRIVWTPTVELYHHESASAGRHDARQRKELFERERKLMRQLWGPVLDNDPFYSPNLSLGSQHYKLAFPPRIAKRPSREPAGVCPSVMVSRKS